ncbi:MAG TPA: glycosyltransferase family 4 protein, partial [Abditibacterium sp.]
KRRLTPYEEELRRLAEPLGEDVEFQASVDRGQLLREYQAASIFCAPSNWDDPFPLTVLEAMSCGLPVVASRRGGIPEGGDDDILYFQPPDVDELAAQLAALVDSAPLRAEWGARARRRVQNFAWPNQYRVMRQALNLPFSPVPASPPERDSQRLRIDGLNVLGWLALTGWTV